MAALLPAGPATAHEDLRQRLEVLTLLVEAEPADAGHRMARSRVLLRLGRFAEALADLDAAERLAPHDRDVWLERGRVHLARGAPADAAVAIDRYLTGARPDRQALVVRARARAELGQVDSAVADYDRAVDLAGRLEDVLARGALLVRAGRLDQAVRGYRGAPQRLRDAVALRDAIVNVEVQRRRFDAALLEVDAALRRPDGRVRWLLVRADVLRAAGRNAVPAYAAAASAAEALLHRRASDLVRMQRARAWLGLGRRAEAIAELEGIVRRSPHLRSAVALLAEARRAPPTAPTPAPQ